MLLHVWRRKGGAINPAACTLLLHAPKRSSTLAQALPWGAHGAAPSVSAAASCHPLAPRCAVLLVAPPLLAPLLLPLLQSCGAGSRHRQAAALAARRRRTVQAAADAGATHRIVVIMLPSAYWGGGGGEWAAEVVGRGVVWSSQPVTRLGLHSGVQLNRKASAQFVEAPARRRNDEAPAPSSQPEVKVTDRLALPTLFVSRNGNLLLPSASARRSLRHPGTSHVVGCAARLLALAPNL